MSKAAALRLRCPAGWKWFLGATDLLPSHSSLGACIKYSRKNKSGNVFVFWGVGLWFCLFCFALVLFCFVLWLGFFVVLDWFGLFFGFHHVLSSSSPPQKKAKLLF